MTPTPFPASLEPRPSRPPDAWARAAGRQRGAAYRRHAERAHPRLAGGEHPEHVEQARQLEHTLLAAFQVDQGQSPPGAVHLLPQPQELADARAIQQADLGKVEQGVTHAVLRHGIHGASHPPRVRPGDHPPFEVENDGRFDAFRPEFHDALQRRGSRAGLTRSRDSLPLDVGNPRNISGVRPAGRVPGALSGWRLGLPPEAVEEALPHGLSNAVHLDSQRVDALAELPGECLVVLDLGPALFLVVAQDELPRTPGQRCEAQSQTAVRELLVGPGTRVRNGKAQELRLERLPPSASAAEWRCHSWSTFRATP